MFFPLNFDGNLEASIPVIYSVHGNLVVIAPWTTSNPRCGGEQTEADDDQTEARREPLELLPIVTAIHNTALLFFRG